ncbi:MULTISPECIES: cyclic-di-AMP-binding protein CbpB [Alteribacter]|uniref:CBS domain-containing protein n=1 Tax=Alteribacter keqinensis TaxID=2483800 RepID=A0A3M7TW59_9BACI|nr:MULTISPECIES: cyclic-di-AMP-binding protein CbpB [Alteribacter]MBM7097235.1 CBS domain-containing protein [Alteribacter salitolerans]RNA69024.1 CBS domain-containing protein [Alteribacter keqinensis]
MQNLQEYHILQQPIESFIISAEEVAHVQPDNSLEHALLVLVKSGYTAIPVLDTAFKLRGLISKAQILDSIIGIEKIEPDRLHNTTVTEVMSTTFACVKKNSPFEKALSFSINNPFICVEDEKGAFLGIITRSKLLAYLNGYLHDQKKRS